MYPAGKHPLYPYTIEEKNEVLQEAGLNKDQLDSDINAIMDWFQKQPHLEAAGICPEAIETFLVIAKGSVEIAKQRIDNFYRLRLYAPEIINDRIKLLNDPNKVIWDTVMQAPLPRLFKGRRISVIKYIDPDNCITEHMLINSIMLGDIRLCNDIMLGSIWIVDLKGVNLSHMFKHNIMTMSKAASLLHDGAGYRVLGIHIINCGLATIAQFIMSVFKPLFSEKVFDRLVFHSSIKDLHEHIPKEYLPKDYDGDLPSIEDIRDTAEKLMKGEKTKQFLIDCCKHVSDESKRPKTDTNQEYIQGHFKKLELD